MQRDSRPTDPKANQSGSGVSFACLIARMGRRMTVAVTLSCLCSCANEEPLRPASEGEEEEEEVPSAEELCSDQEWVDMALAGGGMSGLLANGSVCTWGIGDGRPGSVHVGTYVDISTNGGILCAVGEPDGNTCFGPDDTLSMTGEFRATADSEGPNFCGRRPSGEWECRGLIEFAEAVPDIAFVDVSVGFDHACGLDEDGLVSCWGNDEHGQASPPGLAFVAVDAGSSTTCGLTPDGSIECWGDLVTSPPAGEWSEIVVGGDPLWDGDWGCALSRVDGTIECWGERGGEADSFYLSFSTSAPYSYLSGVGNWVCAMQADGDFECG